MTDTKFIYKRIGAYIVDVFLVTLLVTAFSSISFLNPLHDEATEMSTKYADLYKDTFDVLNKIDGFLDDDKISEEELKELKEYERLLPFFSKYEGELNKEEADKMLDDLSKYYEESVRADSREMKRLDLYRDIIQIVLLCVYFIVVPMITKGVTLGKRVFNLKVVKEDESEATLINYLIRWVMLYGVVFTIISLVLSYTLSVKDFPQYDNIVSYLSNAVLLATFGVMVFRKDCRSLHDLLSKTKVISTKEEVVKEEVKEEKVEQEEVKKELKIENKKEVKEAKVEKPKKKKTTKKKNK